MEGDIIKRIKNIYQQIYDFENLHHAYLEARKNKRYRREVLAFSNNLEENLITIQNELIWKTYEVGRYREFYVHEPKKRLIMALPFKDRVVQWAVYRILNPYFEKRYILDSCACREGYGIHRASMRMQYWLRYLSRKNPRIYALKLDISKYFYRVSHDVLMGILHQIIADKDILWLLETIVRCEHTNFGVQLGDHQYEQSRLERIGMPIGNLTSQMFANLYLNELDQYVKHELKIRHYIRYMDDVVILHHDKKHLWHLKNEISCFLNDKLFLTLNNKTSVRTVDQGIDFCGYRIWSTHMKLRKKSALRMKRRIKYLKRAYAHGKIDFQDVNASVQSYLGLMLHCSSYKLKTKLLDSLVLVRDNLIVQEGG